MLAAGQAPAGLVLPQRSVEPAARDQRIVRALLDDAAGIEHDNAVHPRQRRQPVRDGDDGLARHQRVQLLLDRMLGLGVERGGGLVQHQDRRVL